jgi:hypothetical protein
MIFTKQNKAVSGETSFTGAYLPQQLINDISFLALCNQTSKTSIISQLLQEGVERAFAKQAKQEMYETIANHAQWVFNYDKKQPNRKYSTWIRFLAECRRELLKKKYLNTEDSRIIMNLLLKMEVNQ